LRKWLKRLAGNDFDRMIKERMVLTPTYHVFRMYKVHQDAEYLPFDLICNKKKISDNRVVPSISATVSRNKDGVIHIHFQM
jgi:alpha-N-arabinofuranosidase